MSDAHARLLSPALRYLVVAQSRAKIRRAWKRLRSRRRAVPTTMLLVLLILYAIQIYIAMAYGGPRTHAPIESAAPLGMLGILLIKLLAICIDREKSGAGFRGEETHYLLGGPFRRDQVRLYRVSGHAVSILVTAVFAAIFFRFHVASFWAAFCGSYLAMVFTYLVYTIVAVAAVHASWKAFQRARNLACVVLLGVLACGLYRASSHEASDLEFLHAVAAEFALMSESTLGRCILAPFAVFTRTIVADQLGSWLAWSAAGATIVFCTLIALLWIEGVLVERAWRREQRAFPRDQSGRASRQVAARGTQFAMPDFRTGLPWMAGAGPIVWRQGKAVLRLRGGLSWLLLPLAFACAAGSYLCYSPEKGPILTIVIIVVLTSTFLPGLLPFDFRGDLRALTALKMMPIRPRSVVLGQLAAPVALLSLFQLLSLSTLVLHDAELVGYVLLTMLFLVPVNTILLALENLVFLLYPYRVSDFDMQATVRRIVMLMAKFCVLFLAALLSLLVGLGVVVTRAAVSQIPGVDGLLATIQNPLLVAAQIVVLTAIAAGVVEAVRAAYQRFDVSEDLPI